MKNKSILFNTLLLSVIIGFSFSVGCKSDQGGVSQPAITSITLSKKTIEDSANVEPSIIFCLTTSAELSPLNLQIRDVSITNNDNCPNNSDIWPLPITLSVTQCSNACSNSKRESRYYYHCTKSFTTDILGNDSDQCIFTASVRYEDQTKDTTITMTVIPDNSNGCN